MRFLEFLCLLHKRGLSYAISEISFSSPKTWTIICNFWNLFPFSKNVDYHMKFLKFLFLLLKTWNTKCNFWNFFPFFKKMDYHMQFLNLLSLLQNCGLSYAIFGICSPFLKTWTIICNS